jgi:hypothetical protein
MKANFERFILGGKYEVGDADPLYTQIVPTNHFILSGKSGDFAAFFAACVVRREAVASAEEYVGSYVFEERLLVGDHQIDLEFSSPITVLDWWASSLDKIIEIEKSLAYGEEVGIRVDRDATLQGFASMVWLVTRANCRPKGLNYSDIIEKNSEDSDEVAEESDDESMRHALSALEEANKGSDAFLDSMGITEREDDGSFDSAQSKETAMRIVGEDGEVYSALPNITPAESPDGFRPEHIRLLNAMREQIALVAAEVPEVGYRWLQDESGRLHTRSTFGQRIYDLNYDAMQMTFPDIFGAERTREELKSKAAAKAREKTKK